ncbi:MAG: hypothetical protein HKP61_07715 [Dactylosporangium sp.]|nr:hypothetical protein [Dactylosporangium sp.]
MKIAAIAAIGLAGALAAETAASAYVYGDYTAGGVRIRTGPSTGYTAVGAGYPGQHLYDYCYVVGQTINGNVFWDYHKNAATGVTGYSSEYYLTSGSSQYTHC